MKTQKTFLTIFFAVCSILIFNQSSSWALVNSGTCTVYNDEQDVASLKLTLRERVEHNADLDQNGPCKKLIKFLSGETFDIFLQDTLTFINSSGLVVDGAGAAVVIHEGSVPPENCLFDVTQNPNMWFKNMIFDAPNHPVAKIICGDHQEENVVKNAKPEAVCGNGQVEEGEDCDDSKGCCTGCHFAAKDTDCSSAPKGKCDDHGQCVSPAHYCGDGHKDAGEDCDGGECCTAMCKFAVEGTSCNDGSLLTFNDQCNDQGECHGTPIVLHFCGDGHIDSGEVCDDGNMTNNDGCSSTCQVEDGWNCTTDNPSVCTPKPPVFVCGNGVVEPGEQCDDANTTNGDGCSSTCQEEPDYVCAVGNPSVCTKTPPTNPVCGDGIVSTATGEQCDNTSECCKNCLVVPKGFPCNGNTGDQCDGQGSCHPDTETPPACSGKFPKVFCSTGGCSLTQAKGSPFAMIFLGAGFMMFFIRRASDRSKS